MDNKHELTEQLKIIETEIYNDKVDLRSINLKLEASYKYQDELLERMEWAKKQTEEHRRHFFEKSSEIAKKFDRMKNILDVFTGNFYRH